MGRILVLAALVLVAILTPLAWGAAGPAEDRTDAAAGPLAAALPVSPTAPASGVPTQPAVGLTLPSTAGPLSTLVFDDFEWCIDAPCAVSTAAPAVLNVQGFSYTVMPQESWLVQEGGRGGGHAVYAVGAGLYEVRIRTSTVGGGTWQIGFTAKSALVEDGIEVIMRQRVLGLMTDPTQCHFVPVVPAGDGFYEFTAANAACIVAPMTNEVVLQFEAPAGVAAGTLAIDDFIVKRL